MFRLGNGISMERVDGSLVLASEEGDVSVLNATGAVFLEHLLESQDETVAVAAVAEAFDAGVQDVGADCSCLLNELVDLGLVAMV